MSDFIENAKRLCMERDANRCRHTGVTENLVVKQLVPREGPLGWHLSNLITLSQEEAAEADYVRTHGKDNRVGVVLAGGKGTRLYPLTKFQNKHTLPIGLVPMLFYPIRTLRAFGCKRVLIVLDREGASSIIEMLGSGKEFGMDFSFKIQEGAGGISEALYLAKDFAKPGDEIVCVLGDNIFDIPAIDKDVNLNGDKACIFVKKVSNPSAYGVATIENGKVSKIVEKPKKFVSDLAVVGLYLYTYDVFNTIKNVKPSDRGELEISSVNDHYASLGKLQYKMVNGYWGDAGGSIQRYAECSMHGAKEAKVSAEEIDHFRALVFDDK